MYWRGLAKLGIDRSVIIYILIHRLVRIDDADDGGAHIIILNYGVIMWGKC